MEKRKKRKSITVSPDLMFFFCFSFRLKTVKKKSKLWTAKQKCYEVEIAIVERELWRFFFCSNSRVSTILEMVEQILLEFSLLFRWDMLDIAWNFSRTLKIANWRVSWSFFSSSSHFNFKEHWANWKRNSVKLEIAGLCAFLFAFLIKTGRFREIISWDFQWRFWSKQRLKRSPVIMQTCRQ